MTQEKIMDHWHLNHRWRMLELFATTFAILPETFCMAQQSTEIAANKPRIAANGFGVIARIVALTSGSRNAAAGFGAYGFAESVYFRFIERGTP
jgi:hypothetical protein